MNTKVTIIYEQCDNNEVSNPINGRSGNLLHVVDQQNTKSKNRKKMRIQCPEYLSLNEHTLTELYRS